MWGIRGRCLWFEEWNWKKGVAAGGWSKRERGGGAKLWGMRAGAQKCPFGNPASLSPQPDAGGERRRRRRWGEMQFSPFCFCQTVSSLMGSTTTAKEASTDRGNG